MTTRLEKAPPVRPYRILIADDHPVVRHGFRALLESQPDIEVCFEASNGIEALEQVKKCKPDLVVLDLTMPQMNGLEAMCAIREESPSTEVLVLSMHFSEEIAREVLRCGAVGYVLKSDADTDLLAAVESARNKRTYYTTRLAASMVKNFVRGQSADAAGNGSGDGGAAAGLPLSPREIEVVQLLAEGRSNKEVAAKLGVSTRTVESHRNHIMRKMKFGSFSDLVRFAVRQNLVEP